MKIIQLFSGVAESACDYSVLYNINCDFNIGDILNFNYKPPYFVPGTLYTE